MLTYPGLATFRGPADDGEGRPVGDGWWPAPPSPERWTRRRRARGVAEPARRPQPLRCARRCHGRSACSSGRLATVSARGGRPSIAAPRNRTCMRPVCSLTTCRATQLGGENAGPAASRPGAPPHRSARLGWPPGSSSFTIYPESGKGRGQGNGVKIKDGFIESLRRRGWEFEYKRFDCRYSFSENVPAPFVVEWETGNISSSHRAINRIALALNSGGVLVLPSRMMYVYLTGRIGNSAELAPYKELWRRWNELSDFGYFGIVAEPCCFGIPLPASPRFFASTCAGLPSRRKTMGSTSPSSQPIQ